MKVIFVGIHSKIGYRPLDSKTKSGQIIDSIIALVNYPCVKSNLFLGTKIPPVEKMFQHSRVWKNLYRPEESDIIVLLGRDVQRHFPFQYENIVKIYHPAVRRTTENKWKYIDSAASRINSILQ